MDRLALQQSTREQEVPATGSAAEAAAAPEATSSPPPASAALEGSPGLELLTPSDRVHPVHSPQPVAPGQPDPFTEEVNRDLAREFSFLSQDSGPQFLPVTPTRDPVPALGSFPSTLVAAPSFEDVSAETGALKDRCCELNPSSVLSKKSMWKSLASKPANTFVPLEAAGADAPGSLGLRPCEVTASRVAQEGSGEESRA